MVSSEGVAAWTVMTGLLRQLNKGGAMDLDGRSDRPARRCDQA